MLKHHDPSKITRARKGGKEKRIMETSSFRLARYTKSGREKGKKKTGNGERNKGKRKRNQGKRKIKGSPREQSPDWREQKEGQ